MGERGIASRVTASVTARPGNRTFVQENKTKITDVYGAGVLGRRTEVTPDDAGAREPKEKGPGGNRGQGQPTELHRDKVKIEVHTTLRCSRGREEIPRLRILLALPLGSVPL